MSFRDPIKNPMLNLVRGLLHLEITISNVRYNTLSFSTADFQTFRLFRDSRLLRKEPLINFTLKCER